MQLGKGISLHFKEKLKVSKSLVWKRVALESGLGAAAALRELSYLFPYFVRSFREKQMGCAGYGDISHTLLDQWTQKHFSVAANEEVVETAGAGFFHRPGFKVLNQGIGMKTPLELITRKKIYHFLNFLPAE